MNIIPASTAHKEQALSLLRSTNLPTEDLSQNTKLFVAEENNEVVGTIALEFDGVDGLLRSLSVDAVRRNTGLGKKLVSFLENYGREQGVKNIYLFTTTAKPFFQGMNYEVIDRNDLPAFIQQTSEYRGICPASATVMKKMLL